jgi:hypothetical protein
MGPVSSTPNPQQRPRTMLRLALPEADTPVSIATRVTGARIPLDGREAVLKATAHKTCNCKQYHINNDGEDRNHTAFSNSRTSGTIVHTPDTGDKMGLGFQ